MADFNDKRLVASLKGLPVACRVAFAAACAQRLIPSYKSFCAKVPDHACAKPPLASDALSRLWGDIGGEEMGKSELQELATVLTAAIPTEDEAYEAGEPYAEDAVAAVAYAFRERVSGSGEDAMWAAQRVYGALDHYVINSTTKPQDKLDEQAVLNHPLVQKELLRQSRDLETLRSGVASGAGVDLLARELQRTAERESTNVFS